MADLIARLQALPGVDFVQDDRDWLARLDAVTQLARRLLWLVSGVLSLGIVLVVGNTVRLSIESRRAEVEIAKLFGASDAFVRRPFLYHGLYYGMAGATLAWVLLAVAGAVLAPALERLATLYPGWAPVQGAGAWDFLGLLTAGAILGLAGAWVWVGRHLRRVEPR